MSIALGHFQCGRLSFIGPSICRFECMCAHHLCNHSDQSGICISVRPQGFLSHALVSIDLDWIFSDKRSVPLFVGNFDSILTAFSCRFLKLTRLGSGDGFWTVSLRFAFSVSSDQVSSEDSKRLDRFTAVTCTSLVLFRK